MHGVAKDAFTKDTSITYSTTATIGTNSDSVESPGANANEQVWPCGLGDVEHIL